jgi:hypothetical protein
MISEIPSPLTSPADRKDPTTLFETNPWILNPLTPDTENNKSIAEYTPVRPNTTYTSPGCDRPAGEA